MTEVPELHFEVRQEEDGGYSARCQVPGHSLFTQADDLDELHDNLLEVSLLYLEGLADDTGQALPSTAKFSMHFVEPAIKAA